nr:Gag-Pol polyprotein [Tanacetum cinerariifolium]
MSTQQDIYAAGSESPPPMLNKENYVPWSSRLLRYAKNRPNGKLIHNSILNGPYVRKMIPKPGDANREITVTETFHLQTDDELSDKELKQIEADDQAIQTILLGLPEDIYAAVDKKIASNLKFLNNLQPEWSRHVTIVHQTKDLHTANYTQLYDFLKYNKKQNYLQQPISNPEDITDPTTAMNIALALMAKAFKLNYSTPTNNNQRISSNPRNRNQSRQYAEQNARNPAGYNDVIGNQIGNGNLVAARADGNAVGQNGNQIRCYNCRGLGHYARNCTIRPKRRDVAYLQTQLLIAQKEVAGIQLQVEEYDLIAAAANLDEIKEYTELLKPIPESHQVPQNDNDVISEETSVEQGGETIEQHPSNFEETRALYDSLYQNLATEEKKRLKSDFKTREDELLDKQIQLEKKINELNNILLKTGQSIQTIHMLSSKPDSFYHIEQKMALGYQNPFYLKQAQKKQQSLYDGKVLLEKHDPPVVYDSEKTLQLAKESRKKIKKLNKEIKPSNYTKINHLSGFFVPQTALSHEELYFSNNSKTANVSKSILIPNEDFSDDTTPSVARKFLNEEAAKFVRDFKSLANEADASLAKHKALELEIKCLLKAVDTSKNTKFAKQPIVENLPKVGETNALSKPVTSNSVSTPQESKGVNNDKVIAPGMFKINPFKTSREEKHVPNTVSAIARTKPITVSQPPVITKKNVNSDLNGLSSTGVDNTKTKRPQSRSNIKHDRVPSVSKSSRSKNKEAEVEEHHRNLLLSKNNKHISSACNNIKIDSQDIISKVVCAMCNKCLISINHDKCLHNYVNGKNSSGKKQKAKVSVNEIQMKYHPEVTKPKKVESHKSLATPKPRKSRLLLRWSPTGRLFDQEGKIVDSSESNSHPDCVNGDNACTSNSLEPKIKRFPNSTSLLDRNDHVAVILGFGDLQWGNILITRVYFVEGLGHNLFSIRQFCDSDLEVVFRRNACLPKFKYHKKHLCPSSEQGKSKRASHPPKPVPNSRQRLHLLYMDLCGPMRIASINGKRYVLVIVYDYSRYTWVHFLRSKDEAPAVIITFLKRITVLLQSPVIIIKTDNDTEFKNQVLKEYFDPVVISHQMSSVRTPQQNGVNDREDIGKLGAKCDIGFFIGYSANSCAYKIYNQRTKKIIKTMNVLFDELSAMAFEQRSSKPRLQSMTFGQISSGLDLTYAPSTITTQQPSKGELDLLFKAMYDDYIGGKLFATGRTDVDELNSNAMVDGNTFVNPFANSSTSAAASSSTQNVDPSNMNNFYQPYPHEFQWTKDHPLKQNKHDEEQTVIRNKSRLVVRGYRKEEGIDFEESFAPSKYVLEILKKYGMESCDPVGTPMEIKDKLDLDQNGTPIDATKYHSMIGALMYLTSSRSDIVRATCFCARYQAKPTENHLKEVKRIFHADNAGCKDTFKSTFDGAQFLGEKLTDYQLAGIFTKALPANRFNYLARRLGMRSLSPKELERLAKSQ